MENKPRFFQQPSQSFFLFGPRGTGKSTLIKQLYEGSPVINLLIPETYREYLANPSNLEQVARGSTSEYLIIDEVQRIPALLDVVHDILESKLGINFVLTGSSARKLRSAGVNLLAGRALLKNLHPFMAAEIGDQFSLSRALEIGMLPLALGAIEAKQTLASYISLYLEQELKLEGYVRDIGAFAKFLEVLSFSQASQLNLSAIGREAGVKRSTVSGYLEVLEDLLLSFNLPVFTKRAKRELSSQEKFYYFDCGVFLSLRPRGVLEDNSKVGGFALETLVAQHLRAWADYRAEDVSLSYWRTKGGLEVDFVLYGEQTFCALEVKSSSTIHPKDLNGLSNFLQDYSDAKAALLYMGKERRKIRNIDCIPIEPFLASMNPSKTLLD